MCTESLRVSFAPQLLSQDLALYVQVGQWWEAMLWLWPPPGPFTVSGEVGFTACCSWRTALIPRQSGHPPLQATQSWKCQFWKIGSFLHLPPPATNSKTCLWETPDHGLCSRLTSSALLFLGRAPLTARTADREPFREHREPRCWDVGQDWGAHLEKAEEQNHALFPPPAPRLWEMQELAFGEGSSRNVRKKP